MKKVVSLFKKIIAVTVILVIAVSVLCIGASAAEEPDAEYYCRAGLSTLENGAALVRAYDKIVAGIASSSETISIKDSDTLINAQELNIVFDAYRRDHPEHFWIGNEYSYSILDDKIVAVNPTYIMSGTQLESAKELFEIAVSEMLGAVNGEMSEYEKELYFHDELAKKVIYQETENAHNAYGALVEGIAVCEGYAEALQYLLQRAGIQSLIVLGESNNPSSNLRESHAWNIVRIDGKYYHVDLTWNDQTQRTYHAYFNKTDAAILEDHIIESTAYPLPVCDNSDLDYFTVNGNAIDTGTVTVEDVADAMSLDGKKASFYVNGDVDAFILWYQQNILAIAQRAGVSTSFSYGYSTLGKEVYLYINDCQHSDLTHVVASPASCTADGNIEHYVCRFCGAYFLDAEAETPADKSEVEITKKGHDFTARIETDQYVKEEANCQNNTVYWYACTRCEKSAATDPGAQSRYYSSAEFGKHSLSTTLSFDSDEHFYACTVDGCDYREGAERCSGGEASCSEKAVCKVCKHEYGELLDHTPGSPATATEAQICLVCKKILAEATHPRHEAGQNLYCDETNHWHLCTGCEEILDLEEHIFDGVCDTECNVCGAVRTVEHTYSDVWYASTDNHYKKCSCGSRGESEPHGDKDGNGICDICNYTLDETKNTPDASDDEEKGGFASEYVVLIGAGVIIVAIVGLAIKLGGR